MCYQARNVRPRSRLLAALVCAMLLARAGAVSADALPLAPAAHEEPRGPPDPPVTWAVTGGALTAMVPLAIGGSLIASSYDVGTRKGATLTMMAGLALSPIVSHLIVREWTRAAIFGAIPVACLAGMVGLLQLQPTADIYGTTGGRLTYGALLSFAALSAGLGLLDTFGATRRAAELRQQKRSVARSLAPAPLFFERGGGLTVAGAF